MLVGLFSFLIMIAMTLQRQQSYFENTIDSIKFECGLAYDEKYELRETIDHNYVQQIVWKIGSIRNYPVSFTSKILLKEEANDKSLDESWEYVMYLVEMYSEKRIDSQK